MALCQRWSPTECSGTSCHSEANQARQVILPDLRADLPDLVTGTSKPTIMEVKTVSGTRFYLPTCQKEVERRVKKVATEHTTDARDVDIKLYLPSAGPFYAGLRAAGPVYAVATSG